MEAGAHLRPARLRVAQLRRSGYPAEASMLVAVCSAAVWTQERKFQFSIKGVEDPVCPRCGSAPETMLHRAWQCPANDLLPACRKSNQLAKKAAIGAETLPCFWIRGIVPASWTAPPSAPPKSADPGGPTNPIWDNSTYIGNYRQPKEYIPTY